jgi:hypothetical protein
LQDLSDANQSGPAALAEFSRAPAATQTAFWAEVRRRNDDARRWVGKVEAEAAESGLTLLDFWRRYIGPLERRWRVHARRIWNQRWRDRAYRDRVRAERGVRIDHDFEAEKDRLLAIPADEYAEHLAPDQPRRGRLICCPAHEERTPSCSLNGTRWHCFGCGEGGSIYDFAGVLWDLPRFGRAFREIHERLLEVFP